MPSYGTLEQQCGYLFDVVGQYMYDSSLRGTKYNTNKLYIGQGIKFDSVKELAIAIGYSIPSVYNWLRDINNLDYYTLPDTL